MRRTGVIVGVHLDLTHEQAEEFRHRLMERYPGAIISLVSHASSVAFEFDDGVPEPWPPPQWSTHVPSVDEVAPALAFDPEYLEVWSSGRRRRR